MIMQNIPTFPALGPLLPHVSIATLAVEPHPKKEDQVRYYIFSNGEQIYRSAWTHREYVAMSFYRFEDQGHTMVLNKFGRFDLVGKSKFSAKPFLNPEEKFFYIAILDPGFEIPGKAQKPSGSTEKPVEHKEAITKNGPLKSQETRGRKPLDPVVAAERQRKAKKKSKTKYVASCGSGTWAKPGMKMKCFCDSCEPKGGTWFEEQ